MKTSLLLLLVLLAPLPFLFAQEAVAGLDVQADNLQFEAEENMVTATGNVMLRKGARSLKADVITYNTVTEQAFARGNVVFTNEDQIWRGEELRYNFITGEGSFPNLNLTKGPFTVNADSLERLGPVQSRMSNVVVTTCPDPKDPEFSITAKTVDVYEEEIYLMRNAVFRLHGVPFFWVPRLTIDQEREPTHLDVIPGYGSREGFMLLNSYNRYPAEGYRTKTHLDYRSERGFAAGQDWFWFDPQHNNRDTKLRIYGALDDAPYKNEDQEAQLRSRGIDIDEERYRLKFEHRQSLSDLDALWVKANYLSDARVVEDFFEEEYRREPIPETRATYSAIGDTWNANVDVERQLNEEEFESVNRLPEATFNVPLRPLGETELLYESETRAGYLEKTFTAFQRDEQEASEYDSLRLHTDHTVFYPSKFYGWLNVIPRAGLALTYYDTTRRTERQVTPESMVNEDGVVTTSFSTNSVDVAQSGDIRLLPEIGLETSFKAFGLVHEHPTLMGTGLRHVVEPFLDYTFIPEPDLKPDEIYFFDEIDELGEEHEVAFGVRNKWQTRRQPEGRGSAIHDLVNLDVRTVYDLRSEADPHLGDLEFDLILHPNDWVRMRIKADVDTEESRIPEATSEIRFRDPQTLNQLQIDQRYLEDRNHTLQFRYKLNPKGRFGLRGYTRTDLEEDGFEEQALTFIIRTDCLGYGIGGSWQRGETYTDGGSDEDEWKVYLQFWLRAFPRAVLGTGDR